MPRSRFHRELAQAQRPRSVRELEAVGVTRAIRAGPSWRQTSRGFYVPVPVPASPVPASSGPVSPIPSSPTQRILEATSLVPATGAITGWAAAFARGVDNLDGVDPDTLRPLAISIVLGRDVGRRSAPLICFCRDALPPNETVMVRGIPFVSPARATFDGCRLAPGLPDAVAFVDAMARAQLVDLEHLLAYADEHASARGVRQARRAFELADPASRNPWESRVRVLYRVDLGLPRPLLNVPIFGPQGQLLGIPDFLDEEAGHVLEFDGQGHRDRRQHREDNVREELFEGHNLTVTRADSLDYRHHRPELARRILDGRCRGQARDRSKDSWTTEQPAWWRRRRRLTLPIEEDGVDLTRWAS